MVCHSLDFQEQKSYLDLSEILTGYDCFAANIVIQPQLFLHYNS
jgi:hypothetical protein